MQTDLDELSNELRASEERAKKALADAARLADELRQEQEHRYDCHCFLSTFLSSLYLIQVILC